MREVVSVPASKGPQRYAVQLFWSGDRQEIQYRGHDIDRANLCLNFFSCFAPIRKLHESTERGGRIVQKDSVCIFLMLAQSFAVSPTMTITELSYSLFLFQKLDEMTQR